MAEDFNEELKAFSEKHGAVLLGMHHEIKEMQASVDESKKGLEIVRKLSASNNHYPIAQQLDIQTAKDEISIEVRALFDSIYTDVQANLSRSEKELSHIQVVGKQLDERVASAAENERLRFAGLSSRVEEFVHSKTLELNKYKKLLDAKQLELDKLHGLCLALLKEHKQREMDHQQKVEKMRRIFNRVGLAILIVLVIGLASMWALKWMQ